MNVEVEVTKGRVADYMRVTVPPPLVTLVLAAAGTGLHLLYPVRLLPQGKLSLGIGLTAIVAGTITLVASIQTLRRAGTDHTCLKGSTSIVKYGPYRWSRNPMYLGPMLWLFGLAFAVNTAWLLVGALLMFLFLDRWVVRLEERYLEEKFGEGYLEYKASVRRWI